jgi:L-cystine transport system permease protein
VTPDHTKSKLMFFDIEYAIGQFPKILSAAPTTLLISSVSMVLGIFIGFALTLCRMYKVPVLQRLSVFYISFVRGTPMVVQLYLVFFGVPAIFDMIVPMVGLKVSSGSIPPITYAFVSFSLNAGAFLAETVRSALSSVEAGQMEAAYSVGLTTSQGLRRIVVPQALVAAVPNFGNAFLLLIKGSSLAFVVMVVDILSKAKIEAADGYRYMENYLVASVIYWAICAIFEKVFVQIENRLKRYKREITA